MGVIGENGAGKSTLMRVLCGELRPDIGRVYLDAQEMQHGVQAARRAGIAIVHQELSLVSELTVAENICLEDPPTRFGFVRTRARRDLALAALERAGVELDPDQQVGNLALAARQFVEVAKALRRNPKVLILDEPTAALTPQETKQLHRLLRDLLKDGISLVYISHRLEEVLEISSRIVVLRDGRTVAELQAADTNPDALVSLMVGRELTQDLRVGRSAQRGQLLLRATGIRAPRVRDLGLELYAREIVGVGGIVGAGRSEFVRAMIGIDPRDSGHTEVMGNGRFREVRSYAGALASGISFVPEERRVEGITLDMSVSENLTLPSLRALSRFGFERRGAGREIVDHLIRKLAIKVDSPRQEAGTLSGGNQQKLAFGKWLPRAPRVVVLDEPTRGVDVGAKAEIHRLIRDLADQGAAILLVSSDLPELLALSDRIVVLAQGRIAGTLDGDEATAEAVMSLATGTASRSKDTHA